MTDFARVAIEERRDEIQAKRDRRNATWGAVGKGAAFVFSTAGLGLILSFILKACAHPAPAKGDTEPAQEAPLVESSDVLPSNE